MKGEDNPKTGSVSIAEAQIRLLERLCTACAVSGDEGEVRKIVLEEVRAYADDVTIDSLGNVLVARQGKGATPLRVMLAAHMDEVGFMLTSEEEEGIFRFETVGGIDARFLAGKAVWIGHDHIPGVIGLKPIHLSDEDELRGPLKVEALRIDVGSGKNSKVKIGDRATFATSFLMIGGSVLSKALDNRLGVATLIELVKRAPENITLLAAFTVQEEVGLRGARVAAYRLEPDLAIVLDSTPAIDLPTWDGSENSAYNTRLDAGAAIYTMDSGTLSDPRLVRFLIETAEEAHIPYQLRQPGRGGTDAGAIHRQRRGIPSVSVSVPGRYAHTPAGIARLADWKASLELIHRALTRLTPDVLAGER